MSGLSHRRWKTIGFYLGTGILTSLLVALIVQPWTVGNGIFALGGDDLWLQASAQVASNVGPFAVDPNLGWPVGYSLWSVPQLGVFLAVLLWIIGGVVGATSAATVFWAFVVSCGLTASACLFFFRSVVPKSPMLLAVPLAIALGGSPAGMILIGHLNVSTWFAVPMIVGTTFRIGSAEPRARIYWIFAVLGIALISPLWWLVVCGLLLSLMAGIAVLLRDWTVMRERALILLAMLVGLVAQLVFYSGVADAPAVELRGKWDSNIFGGHFLDIVLGSPLADTTVIPFDTLVQGASWEFKPVGVIAALAVVLLVVFVLFGTALSQLFGKVHLSTVAVMSQWSIVTLLSFLLGGFGNIQAGLAVLAGGGSPARTWSRLALLLAMFGMAWFLMWFVGRVRQTPDGNMQDQPQENENRHSRARQLGAVAVAVAVVAVYFVDARAVNNLDRTSKVASQASFPEYPAVEFIRSKTATPCPVLQLPVTAGLAPRTTGARDERAEFYYRGYVPYLIAPDYAWTYGAVSKGALAALDEIGAGASGRDAQVLEPFCAVLYDQREAQGRLVDGEPQPGSDVRGLGDPDFNGDRFEVFLLRGVDRGANG